ncbi:cytochrome c oxidase assembly factor Coa1 family protein [Gaetbulibacter aquiaggeris]|uniref:Cytochrome c oxidase assembly factor Coa1 family protein n=1 Tax=Gaetbulibacter aquiaggeris TaxID=1735373 RepID=A0ABW7MPP9_9FLAO
MYNELIKQKSWWNRNWKWFVPVSVILLILAVLISSGMGGIGADLAKAYSDTELYENALNRVKSDQKVIKLLGDIEPIDKLAILEGEVQYTNDNQTVNSTIRIKGVKGKARMDIIADRINNEWEYKKINVRIKSPPEKKQTIEIIKME